MSRSDCSGVLQHLMGRGPFNARGNVARKWQDCEYVLFWQGASGTKKLDLKWLDFLRLALGIRKIHKVEALEL